ncbi:SGNH/GDSL hydrolase family protein [Amycolatopsis cihanbeyliensis]|uniref:Lysophospholipase L1-like esterase n=1 Tax=Amycolatopsis cihanbeyliensis TaxID=1128664 RepID=A0A542DCS7_AMYCI|nr:SGNH/GDSL hydrolase family protein [Amycolatopsis cihanbeyliensis]TQJ00880.1 lysophospholipase L1-like esterase [Amycolatopsis cihanbeyliensis]
MRHGKRFLALLLGIFTAAGLLAGPGTAGARPESTSAPDWSGTWSASVMRAGGGLVPNWSLEGFENQTVRQVVRVSHGGAAVRIRLSNVYGHAPLTVTGATIARSAGGAAVRPDSLRHVTFGRSPSVVIPAGAEVASDLAPLRVEQLGSVTVTVYFAEPTGPATFHADARATSYRAAGDHRADHDGNAFSDTTRSWYYLSGVEVAGVPAPRDAVVAFGNSITGGTASTPDANNRYPDELAERLAAGGRPRPVLNAGISGNRVITDCVGEKALTRFARDALDQPRVGTVIVLQGINDIGFSEIEDFPCSPNPEVTSAELIAGHRELIHRARARGIEVIGATLLPYKGAFYYSERGERVRDELNRWIRTSGEYDAVVDLDRHLAAPADQDRLDPAYDSGDHLHPSDAGYHAMAEAVAPLVACPRPLDAAALTR